MTIGEDYVSEHSRHYTILAGSIVSLYMAGLDAGDKFGESGLEFRADQSHIVSCCRQLVYNQNVHDCMVV